MRARRFRQRAVDGCVSAEVGRVSNQPQLGKPLAIGFDYRHAIIRRAIIDDDDFVGRQGLSLKGLERPPDKVRMIVIRNKNCDRHELVS